MPPKAFMSARSLQLVHTKLFEFATLDRELPDEAVRRTKRPEDRNAMAVVDRGIQTLKKDLATRVASVHGAPEEQT